MCSVVAAKGIVCKVGIEFITSQFTYCYDNDFGVIYNQSIYMFFIVLSLMCSCEYCEDIVYRILNLFWESQRYKNIL